MRTSVASLRSSIAPGAQHPPSAETLAGLDQKKKEAEAVDALQRASALFLQRLEGLADDCEAMADAGAGTRFSPWLLRSSLLIRAVRIRCRLL
jgi:hypothetical protein